MRRTVVWRKLALYAPAALALAGVFLWLSTPNVRPLVTTPPEETAFMRLRREEAAERGRAFRLQRTWRSLDEISPHLRHAIIVSEDAAFYDHDGIDLAETFTSFKRNLIKRRLARGGSTITQQLAKNLYLSPSKNPVRKLRELIITLELETHLSKDRIFELYLNSIEWGDGVFGAEAAAKRYFGTSARRLTQEQAAILAAIVPSPLRWGGKLNSRVVQKRKKIILRRMRARFGGPSFVKPAKPEPPILAAPEPVESPEIPAAPPPPPPPAVPTPDSEELEDWVIEEEAL